MIAESRADHLRLVLLSGGSMPTMAYSNLYRDAALNAARERAASNLGALASPGTLAGEVPPVVDTGTVAREDDPKDEQAPGVT